MPHVQNPDQTRGRGVWSSLSATLIHFFCGIKGVALNINWLHLAFKICAYFYIALVAWVAWHILPLPGHWAAASQTLESESTWANYFRNFTGATKCNIVGNDLYTGPSRDALGSFPPASFCTNRKALLVSMSEGGRIGIDAPYKPRGCQYSWFDNLSICMILERFESIIFIGDQSLQPIYGGFNILLRQDLVHGALQTWSLSSEELVDCSCENQFTRETCLEKFVILGEEVEKNAHDVNTMTQSSPYLCSRVPHVFLKVDNTATLSYEVRKNFQTLAPKRPASFFKHIPVIFSLSAHSTTIESAKRTLLNVLRLADDSARKIDVLVLGPTAPGHIDIKGRKSNQAILDFQRALGRVAQENEVDVLGLWNMTVQAASWDGVRFGESVAITQAMMVINWLARLETS